MVAAEAMAGNVPVEDDSRDSAPDSWWLRIVRHILAAGIFALLMELGSFMPIRGLNDSVFLLWPATGFALGIAIRGGWPYLVNFFFISLLWRGVSLEFGWLFAMERSAALLLAVGLAAQLIRRLLNGSYSLEDIRSVTIFLFVGPIVTGFVLAALTTVALCSAVEVVPWNEFTRLLTPCWLAEAVGILVLAPFSLVWTAKTKVNWSNRQVFEVAIWLVVLMFVGLVVFGNWAPTDTLRYPLELAMFPILCWAAIRFGQRGATVGILIVAILAIWEILQVLGPEQKYISTQPEFIWVFVGVLSATTFFLAAIITEVLRREEKAAANEQHLQAFIDALPDVAFVISEEGRFTETYASKQGQVYHQADRWTGQFVDDHFPAELAKSFRATIREALDSGSPQRIQYPYYMEGAEFWFEGRVAPMPESLESGRQVIWVAYEITERKKAEAALELRDRVLQGVAEATTAMLASKDLNDGIGEALDAIGRYVHVDSIRLVYGSGTYREHKKDSPPPWRWTQAPFASLTGTEKEPSLAWGQLREDWTERLRNGEVIQSSIEKCEGEVARQFAKRKIRTILLTPIYVEGEFFGALELCDQEARQWEESEIASLRDRKSTR
ncbi:MAG: MASE1 domain-containing protein, partial [Puniceicoccales bacterium]